MAKNQECMIYKNKSSACIYEWTLCTFLRIFSLNELDLYANIFLLILLSSSSSSNKPPIKKENKLSRLFGRSKTSTGWSSYIYSNKQSTMFSWQQQVSWKWYILTSQLTVNCSIVQLTQCKQMTQIQSDSHKNKQKPSL